MGWTSTEKLLVCWWTETRKLPMYCGCVHSQDYRCNSLLNGEER